MVLINLEKIHIHNLLWLTGHTSDVLSFAVLPDGSLASGSWDKTIKIWDTIKGIEIKSLTGHTSEVLSLAVLPDGSLASGSADTRIKIWDKKTSYNFR